MNLDRLDLNLLVVLDALLRERSVTRTGQILHLSQSAVSGSLARLREHFHDDIIVRSGRESVLTPFATTLVEPVARVIREIRALTSTRPGFDPGTADHAFRIVASDYAIDTVFPRFVEHCSRHAPNIQLHVEARSADHGFRFKSGQIDCVVCPDSIAADDHPRDELFEDRFVCVVWTGNRRVRDSIDLEQYLDMRHVVRINRDSTQALDDAFLASRGHVRRIAVSVPAFDAVPRLVVGTPYIATVQERIMQAFRRQLPLRVLPLPVPIPSFRYVLQWPRFREGDPAIDWLRAAFREAVAA